MSGPDLYAVPGSLVNLDGSASSDPDNGPQLLGYSWWRNAFPASSVAALVNPTQAKPQFTPDVPGLYLVRLEASDGLASGFSNTLIRAATACDADVLAHRLGGTQASACNWRPHLDRAVANQVSRL